MGTLKVLSAAAAALLVSTGVSYATTVSISGTYTLSFSQTGPNGNPPQVGNPPTLTGDLGTFTKATQTKPDKGTFTNLKVTAPAGNPLTAGPATTPVNFFTTAPASTSGITTCGGSGKPKPPACSATNDIAKGTITATISIIDPFDTAITDTVSDTALYQADYKGVVPGGCTDPGSTGETDCVDWTNATSNTQNGKVILPINLLNSAGVTVDVLDVILFNAQDWDITPQISFELLPPTLSTGHGGATPLPPALPLFAGGLSLLGLLGRRRRKETEA